jgi:hypothetical protein
VEPIWVCPSSRPIISSEAPPETSRKAKEWRRSWMRTSACRRIRSQNRLKSKTGWPEGLTGKSKGPVLGTSSPRRCGRSRIRSQFLSAGGSTREPISNRSGKYYCESNALKLSTKMRECAALERNDYERAVYDATSQRTVHSTLRITFGNNRNSCSVSGQENGFSGASGGSIGIRTLETVPRLHTFQACAFDHSATDPLRGV